MSGIRSAQQPWSAACRHRRNLFGELIGWVYVSVLSLALTLSQVAWAAAPPATSSVKASGETESPPASPAVSVPASSLSGGESSRPVQLEVIDPFANKPAAAKATSKPGGVTDEKPKSVALIINTSALGADAAIVNDDIREKAVQILSAHNFAVSPLTGDTPAIQIHVTWNNAETFHYNAEVRAMRGNRVLTPVIPPFDCLSCTKSLLSKRVSKEVIKAAELIKKSEEQTSAAANKPVIPVEPLDDGGKQGLGGKGKAGAALLALSTIPIGLGIGLTIFNRRVDPVHPAQVQNYRPAGIGLLAGGAAMLITGAVLLGVDRAQAKRARKSRSMAVVPTMLPRGGGVSFVARF